MALLASLLVLGAVVPSLAASDLPGGEGSLAAAAPADAALDAEDECGPDRPETEACAVNALQRRISKRTYEVSAAREGCHDVTEGDGGPCWSAIQWIIHTGLVQHPDWYPGLDANSPIRELQFQAYNSTHPKCPRPCSIPAKALWCKEKPPPAIWKPASQGTPIEVKVLSYNLFWWHLFKIEHGRGNSAGRLIQANMQPKPFDVMGFQECEDPEALLGPVGLLDDYEAFQGDHAICVAYNKKAWALIAKGEEDVAEDMRTEFYGKRGVQWMRLQHLATGRTLLFLNHHGPLSVNSGGVCGGRATASNLLHAMAKHGQAGDLLVLVGDFNANGGSRTVQSLWPHLTQVFNGDSFGGVDNIFSNVPGSAVITAKALGHGGSDHSAVTATVHVGPAGEPAPQPVLEAEPCHTTVQGETCWHEVEWAMTAGIYEHPEWYKGLTAGSNRDEFQQAVHEDAPDKCPPPCGLAGRLHARALSDNVQHLEPAQSLKDLRKAHGSDGCLIEPNLRYVVGGGWTHKRLGVTDPRVCCRHCANDGGCTAWTWSEWANEAHGPECQLHGGGHVMDKMENDGFVSGLPPQQAIREATSVAGRADP